MTVPTVYQALQAVSQDISHIGKNQTNQQQRFRFRGIDDVLNAIHGPLAKHGVAFIPSGITILNETERATKSGSVQFYVRATVHYTIIGPAGDHIDAAVMAEAADMGDKVSSKLLSMAYKYLAFQVLSIPVEGMDDGDAHTPEPVAPETQPAWDHEQSLTSIRHSAALLDKTVAEVTQKIRAENGGLTVEEIENIPSATLSAFAQHLATYANKQKGNA